MEDSCGILRGEQDERTNDRLSCALQLHDAGSDGEINQQHPRFSVINAMDSGSSWPRVLDWIGPPTWVFLLWQHVVEYKLSHWKAA